MVVHCALLIKGKTVPPISCGIIKNKIKTLNEQ